MGCPRGDVLRTVTHVVVGDDRTIRRSGDGGFQTISSGFSKVGKRRGCCMGKRKSPLTKDETQLPSSVTMMTRSANQRLSSALTEHVRRYWEMRALDDLGGDDRFLQIQRGIIRGLVMSQVIAEGHFHRSEERR